MGKIEGSIRTMQGLGLPKVRGTILEVPLRRIIVYWGPLILGNCHIGFRVTRASGFKFEGLFGFARFRPHSERELRGLQV